MFDFASPLLSAVKKPLIEDRDRERGRKDVRDLCVPELQCCEGEAIHHGGPVERAEATRIPRL